MSITALIDADGLLFSCGFAAEKAAYEMWLAGDEHYGPLQTWEKKKDIPKDIDADFELDEECQYTHSVGQRYITRRRNLEPLENCLHLVKTKLIEILENTGAYSYRVFIKGKGNFRDEIAVTRKYKGNRDVSHRPTYEPQIREYLKTYWNAEEVDGREADDEVVRLQWEDYLRAKGHEELGGCGPLEEMTHTVICGCDKDLDQCPGLHYNYNKKEKYWVSEIEGWRNFYEQMLSGDSSDNIVGVEGIGKVGAKKMLAECTSVKEMFEKVHDAYAEVYKEQASVKLTENANLLFLIRELDKEGKPVLWTPPK